MTNTNVFGAGNMTFAFVVWLILLPNTGQAESPVLTKAEQELLELAEKEDFETVWVKGKAKSTPGSAQQIGKEQLERFENDDINRILRDVPGVYLREEDGYGLRPNIGMRGSGSERSAKITLMEDNVLIAPAPYSAPAAYYFPAVTRMENVEVIKGSGAIRFGPNTVGGALNLRSQSIPYDRQAKLDLGLGNTQYAKLHAGMGDAFKHMAYWVEAAKLHSNGFKDIDGGGDSGFNKTDALGKIRLHTDHDNGAYQALELKIGYADEVSNETYTGLTPEDFQATPNRRYLATNQDKMSWDHRHLQLSHTLEINSVNIHTSIYRQSLHRTWKKLEGFNNGDPLSDVLDNPSAGTNALFYSLLIGESNSQTDPELLVMGTNDRTFVSQGIQSDLSVDKTIWGVEHTLKAGIRLHMDSVVRDQSTELYSMQNGSLLLEANSYQQDADHKASAKALAMYTKDHFSLGPVALSLGLRSEFIETTFRGNLASDVASDNRTTILIPGMGALWHPTEQLGLLAGVHRGFIPVSPGQDDQVKPETSINYETGFRFQEGRSTVEAIGFLNDYSNLKGSCSFSAGCDRDMVTAEFNGGDVFTYGLEFLAETNVEIAHNARFPLRLNYTYQKSVFQNSFQSDNPQWGVVAEGDEQPYLPNHQLTAQIGFQNSTIDSAIRLNWNGAMRDVAGQNAIPDDEKIPAYATIDASTQIVLGKMGTIYLTLDNVLNSRYAVSKRPFGLRPGKPRLLILGYKNTF